MCWSCWSCSRNFATVLIVLGMPWNVGGGMIFGSPGYLAFCHFNFYSWTCREMDAPLAALEGSVNNLQQAHVGRTVRLWTRVLFILWLTRDISSVSPQAGPTSNWITVENGWNFVPFCADFFFHIWIIWHRIWKDAETWSSIWNVEGGETCLLWRWVIRFGTRFPCRTGFWTTRTRWGRGNLPLQDCVKTDIDIPCFLEALLQVPLRFFENLFKIFIIS